MCQPALHIKLTWSKDGMLPTTLGCWMWLLKCFEFRCREAKKHETFIVHHNQSRAEKITGKRMESFLMSAFLWQISCPRLRFDHIFASVCAVWSEAALLFLYLSPSIYTCHAFPLTRIWEWLIILRYFCYFALPGAALTLHLAAALLPVTGKCSKQCGRCWITCNHLKIHQ